jgi:hypothetical protein
MPYMFTGVVLPERAQFTLPRFSIKFTHFSSGAPGSATVSIVLNQIAVLVESDHEWDVLDLRNVVRNIVQHQLAVVAYLKGFGFDCAITRVINQRRDVDYVFGIDVPCISKPREADDLIPAMLKLRRKTLGLHGLFIQRCLEDLNSALKSAEDVGFYCYRAIECLRHHCAAVFELSGSSKTEQWAKFRETSGANEDALRFIKSAADSLRHGDVLANDGNEPVKVLTTTWEVVDGYLNSLEVDETSRAPSG